MFIDADCLYEWSIRTTGINRQREVVFITVDQVTHALKVIINEFMQLLAQQL
jgi:hypothetical protein